MRPTVGFNGERFRHHQTRPVQCHICSQNANPTPTLDPSINLIPILDHSTNPMPIQGQPRNPSQIHQSHAVSWPILQSDGNPFPNSQLWPIQCQSKTNPPVHRQSSNGPIPIHVHSPILDQTSKLTPIYDQSTNPSPIRQFSANPQFKCQYWTNQPTLHQTYFSMPILHQPVSPLPNLDKSVHQCTANP